MESLDKNHDYHCHLHKGESSKRQGVRGEGNKGGRGKGWRWGRGTEVRGESQKKFNPLPPSVSIMKHNTVKNRPSVRVILFKTGKGLYLSLKIFSD